MFNIPFIQVALAELGRSIIFTGIKILLFRYLYYIINLDLCLCILFFHICLCFYYLSVALCYSLWKFNLITLRHVSAGFMALTVQFSVMLLLLHLALTRVVFISLLIMFCVLAVIKVMVRSLFQTKVVKYVYLNFFNFFLYLSLANKASSALSFLLVLLVYLTYNWEYGYFFYSLVILFIISLIQSVWTGVMALTTQRTPSEIDKSHENVFLVFDFIFTRHHRRFVCFFLCSVFIFPCLDQQFSVWIYQGYQMNNTIGEGIRLKAELLAVINPLVHLMFVPVLAFPIRRKPLCYKKLFLGVLFGYVLLLSAFICSFTLDHLSSISTRDNHLIHIELSAGYKSAVGFKTMYNSTFGEPTYLDLRMKDHIPLTITMFYENNSYMFLKQQYRMRRRIGSILVVSKYNRTTRSLEAYCARIHKKCYEEDLFVRIASEEVEEVDFISRGWKQRYCSDKKFIKPYLKIKAGAYNIVSSSEFLFQNMKYQQNSVHTIVRYRDGFQKVRSLNVVERLTPKISILFQIPQHVLLALGEVILSLTLFEYGNARLFAIHNCLVELICAICGCVGNFLLVMVTLVFCLNIESVSNIQLFFIVGLIVATSVKLLLLASASVYKEVVPEGQVDK